MFNVEKLTNLSRKAHFFVAREPRYLYTYGRWRLGKWLQKISTHSFELTNPTFLATVDLERPALVEVKKALVQGDHNQAVARLTAYFQSRTDPAFFFTWDDKREIVSLISRDEQVATIRSADEICQNIFNFRRVGPVKFEDGINWVYRPQANIDWTWDLNRHAYFETLGRAYWYTGNEQYGLKFRELLLDWLAKNPAGMDQPNWHSVFEVAFRINTWIWAFYYFRWAPSFDQEISLAFLKGLLAHGRYLDANLELHVPNNHLLLEAKALALLGLLFPEFKEAKRWQQRGLNILYQEVRAQVRPDGVHGEQSTHYHRVIAGELLEFLVLLANNHLAPPTDIPEILARMIEFELWVTKPNGLIPLLSDSALADTHLRFSAATTGPAFLQRPGLKSTAPAPGESSVWLLGPQRVQAYRELPVKPGCLHSRSFPEGGYIIMRAGPGREEAYLVFDCGPFGYKPLPNHGHADALSFELYSFGQTLVVDPGVYSTALGANWRNFFRSSPAHNTVVVDAEDQSILLDTRRVYRPAQATLHQWLTNEQFDFADGSHNGYERLPQPITHRRQIFFVKPEYWVVIDLLTGQGEHCFDLYFHLMPGVETYLDRESKTLQASKLAEPGLVITPVAATNWQAEVITGATNPIQGWVSFFSGEKEPAPAVRFRQEGAAPIQFCTVLYPYPATSQKVIKVLPLAVNSKKGSVRAEIELTGLCIELGTYTDYLLIDRGFIQLEKTFGEYETDAQILYARHRREDDKLLKVVKHGGTYLSFQGRLI